MSSIPSLSWLSASIQWHFWMMPCLPVIGGLCTPTLLDIDHWILLQPLQRRMGHLRTRMGFFCCVCVCVVSSTTSVHRQKAYPQGFSSIPTVWLGIRFTSYSTTVLASIHNSKRRFLDPQIIVPIAKLFTKEQAGNLPHPMLQVADYSNGVPKNLR